MGTQFLIDTNAIIDFSEGRLPAAGHSFLGEIIDSAPCISIITKIELLGFSAVNQVIVDFVNTAVIYGLSDDVVSRTIDLRRRHRIKLPDAVIAATALTYGAIIISRNGKDFQAIDELTCIDLHHL